MKNPFKHIMVAGTLMTALILSVTACSTREDDFDDSATEKTTNALLVPGDAEHPGWQTASDLYRRYEQTMSVQCTLQEVLLPYVSTDDEFCVMVNGEIRAICSKPQYDNGEWIFSLVIAGTGIDKFVSLSYYCSKLKRIYTLDRWMVFSQATPPTQLNGRPYVVTFFN